MSCKAQKACCAKYDSFQLLYLYPPLFFLLHPFVTKEVRMKGDLSLFLKDPSFAAEFLHT